VLTISSEDEDSDVGSAYKRRRTNRIVYSHSLSPPHGGSLMNNPSSATSPSPQTVQEEGVVEFVPLPTPTPAAPTPTPEPLEIPLPIRQLMRGFTDRSSPGSFSGDNRIIPALMHRIPSELHNGAHRGGEEAPSPLN